MITGRRYDLDWLRVIAFFILIYFHTAIFFVPGGLPLIQNPENSVILGIFVDISSQFRLALLFFISGVGVSFARRKLTSRQFVAERSKRLLIPLAFGLLFIVPPMVFTEKVFLGEFNGSLLAFYPTLLTDGVYPRGNLSWHHFWFIAYLFLYCLMSIRLFAWFDGRGKEHVEDWVSQASGLGIYGLILPLILVEFVLRPFFPGFRDLISDWASFSHWFILFVTGFIFANHERLLDTALRLRHLSLFLTIFSTGLAYFFFGGFNFEVDLGDDLLVYKFIAYSILGSTMTWCSILSCLGYAARYLRFSNRLLQFVNEAVYPLFILHLTIITVLGYWAVDQGWPLALKYLFITTLTILLVLGIYRWLIQPFDAMRFVFGVKPKIKQ